MTLSQLNPIKPFLILLLSIFCVPVYADGMTNEIDLSGTWFFEMDEEDRGLKQKFYSKRLKDKMELPGSMPEQGKGKKVGYDTEFTGNIWKKYPDGKTWADDENYKPFLKEDEFRFPFWLISDYHYVGPAWYQKEIEIPEDWTNSSVQLVLERPHWETQAWLNGEPLGMQNALGVPHRFDLGQALRAGKNILTIRVDNRIKDIKIGADSHSISDNTQSNWNGIVGDIKLTRSSQVSVGNVAIFPDLEKKSVKLDVSIDNDTGKTKEGKLKISAKILGKEADSIEVLQSDFKVDANGGTVTLEYPLGDTIWLWDEFDPTLYELTVQLECDDSKNSWNGQFGMRTVEKVGSNLEINGRPLYLRGTLECAIFPKTGYPPTDLESWERIIKVAKAHGLNHIRFHSWCPPKAAFEAADKLGFYYQVEASAWATGLGEGNPIDKWIYEESDRMIAEYGNHPSFCLMPYGNEPHGPKHMEYLTKFVKHYKKQDSRRLYATCAGWGQIPENDFQNVYHYARIQGWNANLNSIINAKPPRSDYDWGGSLERYFGGPIVSHEIGQWCVYPNFREIPKYDGVLKPTNFKIFRDSLESKGLLDLADDYVQASGKLQALCYKADIEAALRSPGFGGFQLLDIRDFPGQGTALVGILDPFWGEKGYISPEEFSRFCSETVPLARFAKRIFTSDEKIECAVEIAHYGPREFDSVTPTWQIVGTDGKIVLEGSLASTKVTWGNRQKLGSISETIKVEKATKFQLQVKVDKYMNSWDIWVYPAELPEVKDDVLVVRTLTNEAKETLKKGGKVLLTVNKGSIRDGEGGEVGVGFSSMFWNTAWTNGQLPHTLGILCDPKHPALAEFPTEFHSNWQWWDAMTHSNAISLENLENKPEPIVRFIDDWVTNRNIAMLFEVKIGEGKLFVSGVDLVSDLEKRPEARQMLYSIKKYMSTDSFAPETATSIKSIRSLFKTPAEVVKAGAKATASSFEKGYGAQQLLDGKTGTMWHTTWKQKTDSYPHSVTIDLGKPVKLEGITCLPRQDGNASGMISEYEVYFSEKADTKGKLMKKGRFSSDSDLKKILFKRPTVGQYLTFVANKGRNDEMASLAEINFLIAKTK